MRCIILIVLALLLVSLLLADTMPGFKLPDINKKEVKLESLLNKGPVLIDFWATWCIPCKKSMTALNQLAEKYDSLTVVVISIDAPKDVSKATSFLKSNNYKFVSLFDSDKKLAKKLNVLNPPRTFILDKSGEIVLAHDGYEPGTEKIYEVKTRELLSLPEEDTSKPETKETPEPCNQGIIPCGGCNK